MKILHITPAYYPATYWGGPIFTVYRMNNALARILCVEFKVLSIDSAGPQVSKRFDVFAFDRTLYPNREVLFMRRVVGAFVSVKLVMRLPPLSHWTVFFRKTRIFS